MKKKLAFAILILSAACMLTLYAQTAEEAEDGPKQMRVMTALEFKLTGSPEAVPFINESETWAAAFDSAIGRSKRVSAVKRSNADSDLIAQATRAGYQVAASVSVLLETGSDTASAKYRLVDVLSRKIMAENIITAPIPYINELSETFWIPLIVELEKITATERHSYIRVRAEPDTVLHGFGTAPLTVGTEGEISIDTFVPGTYSWRAVRRHTQTQTGVFTAVEEDARLVISPKWLKRWSLESGMVMAQFPDVWFGAANVYNRFFFRIGIEQYLFGLFFTNAYSTSSYNSGVVSLPMVMPGITIGGYFGDTAQFIRPYISTSVFLRYNTELNIPDPVGPYAIKFMTGLDWRVKPSIALFGEMGGSYYPGANGQMMAASRGTAETGISDSSSLTFTSYGDGYFLEIPAIRLGARFSL